MRVLIKSVTFVNRIRAGLCIVLRLVYLPGNFAGQGEVLNDFEKNMEMLEIFFSGTRKSTRREAKRFPRWVHEKCF